MEEEISNSSLNFINPSEIELGNSIVELSRRQTCILYSARWNSRRYVIKSLRAEFAANPVYIEALRKEFELGVRLDHPGIIRVVAFEEIATLGQCIIMEWVDGETLNKFLAGKPSGRERRKIARQLAEALAYMHQTGITHRDLKPDNIMITRRGHDVRIIDFGLGDAECFTNLKSSRGTRTYGAPEQQGTPAIADSAADVYSFGKILRELLPRCEKRRLIRRCLRTDPQRRPTMAAVAKALSDRRATHAMQIIFLAAVISAGIAAIWLGDRRHADGSQPPHATIQEVRTDTIYIVPPAARETIMVHKPTGDNTPKVTPTGIPHIQDDGPAHKIDSLFAICQKEADRNLNSAVEEIRKSTNWAYRDSILLVLAENNKHTVAKMEQALRDAGCSERTIHSVANDAWLYITQRLPVLNQ